MKVGEFTATALDHATHPLSIRAGVSVVAALAADGLYTEALELAGQLTANMHAGPEHHYWMACGAERVLQRLVQSRQRRSLRRLGRRATRAVG